MGRLEPRSSTVRRCTGHSPGGGPHVIERRPQPGQRRLGPARVEQPLPYTSRSGRAAQSHQALDHQVIPPTMPPALDLSLAIMQQVVALPLFIEARPGRLLTRTRARRSELQAVLGVAAVDDDTPQGPRIPCHSRDH